MQSHLLDDIEITRGILSGSDASQYNSLGALSSLSDACAAVWQNAPDFDSSSKSFFLFEDCAEAWAEGKLPQTKPSMHRLRPRSVHKYFEERASNPGMQT